MTNQNLTEIIAVLDRSGSMGLAITDVLGGFNTFIQKQKEVAGECKVTLIIFDDKIETLYEAMDIKDFPELTQQVYFARGVTALNDALGSAILNAGNRYSGMPEEQRPGKVIIFVSTDGLENASREFTHERLKEMVKTQTDVFSWEFIFTGADIDSYQVGNNLGINQASTMNFTKSGPGTKALYGGVSDKIAQYRTGQVRTCAFTPEEKSKIETPKE